MFKDFPTVTIIIRWHFSSKILSHNQPLYPLAHTIIVDASGDEWNEAMNENPNDNEWKNNC